jgi:GMP reductase
MKKLKIVKIKSKNIVKNNATIVYDLTIENDESYTVSNKIVHNSACSTFPSTGFGSRNIQASIVHQCANVTNKHIIADGGIKLPADITKAIVLGASVCMVGGMLSAFSDSPGRTVEQDGKMYKEFYGSASAKQSGKTNRIEGIVKLNLMKNTTILEYMDYLSECLQSSISYGGGKKLEDLHSVRWI